MTEPGARLKERMLARGLSGRQLADLANVSGSYVSQVARGYRPSTGDGVARIEAAIKACPVRLSPGDIVEATRPPK